MHRWKRPAIALGLAACLFSCAAGERVETTNREAAAVSAVERADAAAQALGKELMQRLMAELNAGGPTQALTVCSEVAQAIAEQHSRDGMTVRRVSLAVRNPANTPDAYERAKLLEFEALDGRGELPPYVSEVVSNERGEQLRYLRPIRIMPLCLQCHGPAETLDPELVRLLAELYPDDRATGYATGDLRGAVSVTLAE